MSNKLNPKINIQQGASDCGVACLSTIIEHYGGRISIEKLRELSGTTLSGTTLLGLYQAAQKCGFEVQGVEANTDWLKTINNPVILHVIMDNRLQHYIVCYEYNEEKFIIGDPAKGIVEYQTQDLNDIWKSKSLLTLTPNEEFKKAETANKNKKEWFKRLIDTDVPILIIIAIMGLVVSLLGLSLAIFSQQLIDKILPHADKQKLILGLCLVGVLLGVRSWVGYIRGHFVNIQTRDFNNRLIDRFYGSLLYLPKSFFSNRKIGELVARMEDTSRIQTALSFIFGDLLKDALLVLVYFGFVFYYSSIVGLVAFCSLPVFILIAFLFNKRIVNHQHEVMASNAKKSSNYINTLQGIDTIKAHNKEHDFSISNKLIYGVFQDKVFKLGKLGVSLQLVAEIASVVVIISVLAISAFMVLSKQLLIGELTALISIVGALMPSITNLAFANIRIQGAMVAFDRMYEFASIKPEYEHHALVEMNTNADNKIESSTIPRETVFNTLSIKNISFRFAGRKQLFKDVSLEIKKGEITALIGESGCGKSTLFYILEKLYHPEGGAILFNGIPFNEISTPKWRNYIGVVPQEISIFNGNVLENICLASTPDEFKSTYEFCVLYGFDKYFSAFPQSYGTILGEEGVNISGGQKQLIALARALYKKPQLLLLDEPTSAMDRNTERFVFNLIDSLRHKMGVFIITHRLNMAKFSDEIYILENGILAAKGSHTELMDSDNLYSSSMREMGVV